MFCPFARVPLLISTLALAACQAQGDTLYLGNAQVALPLVEKHWRIETPIKGDKASWCVVTAGPNSLALKLERAEKGKVVPVELRSTRDIIPGSSLNVQAGGHYYSTPEEKFAPEIMHKLLADMKQSDGEIYLDWREVGRGHGGRNRLQNRIGLAEFNDAYAQCERYLAPVKKPTKKFKKK